MYILLGYIQVDGDAPTPAVSDGVVAITVRPREQSGLQLLRRASSKPSILGQLVQLVVNVGREVVSTLEIVSNNVNGSQYDGCVYCSPDGCVIAAGIDELPHSDDNSGRGLEVGHALGAGAEVCAQLLPHTPANIFTLT